MLALSSASPAGADDGPITITEPTTIDEPGEYVLDDDIDAEGDGLRILSGDVTLDGNGHHLEGDGSGTGLMLQGTGHTVRNLSVQGFEIGLDLWSSQSQISAVTVRDNSDYGMRGATARDILCDDSTIRENDGIGVILGDYAKSFTMRNCEIVENGSLPIRAGSSATMDIENCRIADNGGPVVFTPMPNTAIEGTQISGSSGAGVKTAYGDTVFIDEPTPITNCVVRDNHGPGIDHGNGFLDVRECTLSGNRIGYRSHSADPRDTILRNNDIEDNEEYGVLHTEVDENPTIDARCNWWGDESGPVHEDNPNENPKGDLVSGDVEFTPWSVERNEDGTRSCEGGLGERVVTHGSGYISKKSYRKLMGVGPDEDVECWDGTFYVTDPADTEGDGYRELGEFSLPTPYWEDVEEKTLTGQAIRAESEAVPVTLPTWGGDRGDCESLLFVDAEQPLPADVEYRVVPIEGPMLGYDDVETNGFAGTVDTLVWVFFELARLDDSEDSNE